MNPGPWFENTAIGALLVAIIAAALSLAAVFVAGATAIVYKVAQFVTG